MLTLKEIIAFYFTLSIFNSQFEIQKLTPDFYITYWKIQHAPNPWAQFPSFTPFLSLHSVSEKHVPVKAASDLAWHSLTRWKIRNS